VLPTVVATLSGTAAVLVLLVCTAAEPTAAVWSALSAMALLASAAIATAVLGAERTARSVLDRCEALRRSTARGQADLRTVVEQLRRGERVPARRSPPADPPGGDEFELLAVELGRSHEGAVAAVVQASRLSSSVGNEQKVEVFVNLARRLQSLVHREIQLLDDLENDVEDPELLKGLFHVDHLATRIRRHAENLAVLGGAISRRQWSRPVTMTEVLRSAIAEVEQYPRIKLVPPIDGTLRGHAVADVIHLLAELVENATVFSSPHTQVLLRAQYVTAGLAIEVEDRGLGMPADEQKKMNGLLADPDQVDVAHLLQDGRIGLFVVSALARRHRITVRLQSNIYGGVQAVLVLPQSLLGGGQDDQEGRAPEGTPAQPPLQPQTPLQHPPPQIPQAQQPPPAPPQAVQPSTYGTHARPQAPAYGTQPGPPPSRPSTDGPAPLPVRGEHAERPTPAAATPGVGNVPLRRSTPTAGTAPAPAAPSPDDTVRTTMGRPQLPKRRGQEHMVPQLREMPAPRSTEEPALHDPGLMAAFQRGIGRAEQAEPRSPAQAEPAPAAAVTAADPVPEPLQEQPQRHDTTSKE
jgi:signal transduction histidine kinase